jgi:hypothetical protein
VGDPRYGVAGAADMSDEIEDVEEPRLWRRDGWTARVIDNDEDDGWAIAMTRDGDSEPALVGPWTMGRDKKNPKPLDAQAFHTLVRVANEVLRRHEQQARARLHKDFSFDHPDGRPIRAELDIVPDEDEPYAVVRCTHARTGEVLYTGRKSPTFRLTAENLTPLVS